MLSELYLRCWKRWQAGERDRALREADYEAMGGIAGPLTRRATALHDDLVDREPACALTIRNLMIRMATVVNGRACARRVPAYELVFGAPSEDRRVEEVLRRFERARLISRGLDRAADGRMIPYVEPVHDELVRGWAPARRWLDELEADTGRWPLLEALASAVHLWRSRRLDPTYLWHDARVEHVKRIGRGRLFALNALEKLFVRRSAQRPCGSQRRLIKLLLAAVTVLALISGLAVWRLRCAIHAMRSDSACHAKIGDDEAPSPEDPPALRRAGEL